MRHWHERFGDGTEEVDGVYSTKDAKIEMRWTVNRIIMGLEEEYWESWTVDELEYEYKAYSQ